MTTSTQLPEQSPLCRCGRDASLVHCPRCGISSVYARSAKRNTLKTRANGDLVSIQTFQCRRCGLLFDDDEWRIACQAPAKGSAGASAGGSRTDGYRPPSEVLPASQLAAVQTSEAQRLAAVARNAPPGAERVKALDAWLKELHKGD